jgi:hypothetical protein
VSPAPATAPSPAGFSRDDDDASFAGVPSVLLPRRCLRSPRQRRLPVFAAFAFVTVSPPSSSPLLVALDALRQREAKARAGGARVCRCGGVVSRGATGAVVSGVVWGFSGAGRAVIGYPDVSPSRAGEPVGMTGKQRSDRCVLRAGKIAHGYAPPPYLAGDRRRQACGDAETCLLRR